MEASASPICPEDQFCTKRSTLEHKRYATCKWQADQFTTEQPSLRLSVHHSCSTGKKPFHTGLLTSEKLGEEALDLSLPTTFSSPVITGRWARLHSQFYQRSSTFPSVWRSERSTSKHFPSSFYRGKTGLGMAVHACNPSSWR